LPFFVRIWTTAFLSAALLLKEGAQNAACRRQTPSANKIIGNTILLSILRSRP
jgi:hypothetical protein